MRRATFPCLIALALLGAAQSPPVVDVRPSRLSFIGSDRAERLPAQAVRIANTGGGELAWRARATAPWVTLAPDRGLAPATLLVGVDARGLETGRQVAQIIIEATGAANSPQHIDVSVAITSTKPEGPPGLQAVPDHVTFSAPAGQSEDLSFEMRVQAEGGAAVNWTARSDKPWLTLRPSEGTTPAALTLMASPSTLANGEHRAIVSIRAGANAPALRVPVIFNVQAAGGRFAFASTGLPAAILNVPYSHALPLRGGRPPYTVQLAGSLPPDLALINGVVRGTPRSPGTFAFTVIASDAAEPAATITETFTLPVVILDQNTALRVEPEQLRLYATAGEPVESATVRVTSGGPTLSWRATSDASWVQIEPASGAAPGTFKVGADTANLRAGTYTASVTVTMPGAPNSPATIPLQLVVK